MMDNFLKAFEIIELFLCGCDGGGGPEWRTRKEIEKQDKGLALCTGYMQLLSWLSS